MHVLRDDDPAMLPDTPHPDLVKPVGAESSMSSVKTRIRDSRWRQLRAQMRSLTEGLDAHRGTAHTLLHHDFWLEALDEQHRYGCHLRAFHAAWKLEQLGKDVAAEKNDDSSFFHWLDHGRGRTLELPECSQQDLRRAIVTYCNNEQRKRYELRFVPTDEVETESFVAEFAATGELAHTDEQCKWIFVVALDGRMYLGRKRKGQFHHSSFVAGRPIIAAGKAVIKRGRILAIEPHSGHFKPALDSLSALRSVLESNHVDVDSIAFIKPKKWKSEWPFPEYECADLDDFASDTDYANSDDRSDTEGIPSPFL